MLMGARRRLATASPVPHVRIVRLTESELLGGVAWDGSAEGSDLYRDLLEAALSDLQTGETLVLSLHGVQRFTSNVYRFLLAVRREVQRRQAQLLLCGLSPDYRQVCDILHAHRLFRFVESEDEALRLAQPPSQFRA